MLIFVGLVLVVIAIGQGYLWWRLVRGTTRPRSRARRVGTVAMVVLGVLPLLAVGLQRADPPRWVGVPVAWVGYVWLALMLYLVLVLLVLEIPRWLLNRRPPPPPPTPDDPVAVDSGATAVEAPVVTRRRAISRGLAVGAGLVAAGTVGAGIDAAMGPVGYRRLDVRLAGLAPELTGLRIALISDLHVGEIHGRDFVAGVVERVNAAKPDLVAICGDLADGSVAVRRAMVEPLMDLDSRFGSYFVTGNHEYFSDAEQWIDYLPKLDVNVLHNERVTLGSGTAAIDLAGVDDQSAKGSGQPGQGANYAKALDGRDPSRPVVLMAHQPIQVHDAERHGVDLQLSGHTHGGQLWPFHGVIALQQGYVSGLHQVGRTQLYVTRGAGFWGPPVRVGAPPDISLVTLRPR